MKHMNVNFGRLRERPRGREGGRTAYLMGKEIIFIRTNLGLGDS